MITTMLVKHVVTIQPWRGGYKLKCSCGWEFFKRRRLTAKYLAEIHAGKDGYITFKEREV